MRLLQVSLRALLLYSLLLVLVSIPVSFFAIREILNKEVDASLVLHSEQFVKHVKNFEYLEDLEMDLVVFDQLSYDITIEPSEWSAERHFQTVSVYDSIEREFRPFRILSSSVNIKNRPYLLTIRMSVVDNNDLVIALAGVQIILILLLVIGVALLNRSLSRKLWKPFYNTLSQLKAYELDKNESIKTEQSNIIEFDDLNKAIGHLTDRNRKVFLQQKEFIENASHELQTPLAIFQSKLDILMQNSSLTETSSAAIQELEETVQRMTRLNKNLLLLSKIDNDQFTTLEKVDVSKIAIKLLENLKPLADLEYISIESKIDDMCVKANKTLIEVLMTNLFHNAIRHTTPKGTVKVYINDRTLKVLNTGNPIRMSPEKMFERFSKENKSSSSTGLGLAIVKKICDSCLYTLQYDYVNGTHTFSVVIK